MFKKVLHWVTYEPVRTYLYGVTGAVLVLLTGYGLMSDEKALLWANLTALVLVPAVEKARSRVTPQASGKHAATDRGEQ